MTQKLISVPPLVLDSEEYKVLFVAQDEARERKKADRKARDKEASYQERLRKWESREADQSTGYERSKLKEEKRVDQIEREGKKLREFLEDYDDDRDDDKYYRGAKLDARMRARATEADRDAEDRAREKAEIEVRAHGFLVGF